MELDDINAGHAFDYDERSKSTDQLDYESNKSVKNLEVMSKMIDEHKYLINFAECKTNICGDGNSSRRCSEGLLLNSSCPQNLFLSAISLLEVA